MLIAAERRTQPVSELLREIKDAAGSTVIVVSTVPVEPFTREMGELAARIDAESRKVGFTIPFADLQIGVTARYLGFEILTDNPRHFQMISGLVVRHL